jgi:UDP-glucuronate 4-epimerase
MRSQGLSCRREREQSAPFGKLSDMKILVTGAAGFIGSKTAEVLLARGDEVIGLDNLNDYYDVNLKLARLARIEGRNNFHFVKADLADRDAIEGVFTEFRPERVINLAAQAGVRYALQNPHAYMDSNLTGFINILEGCRHHGVEHLVFASSSSVYGANTKCRSAFTTMSIIRSASMLPARRRTS